MWPSGMTAVMRRRPHVVVNARPLFLVMSIYPGGVSGFCVCADRTVRDTACHSVRPPDGFMVMLLM